MARPRREIDHERYTTLAQEGLSKRQIARELGIPQSTLRHIEKRLPSPPVVSGSPEADMGIREGDIGIHEEGIPEGDNGIPQGEKASALSHNDTGHPYVSQGIPVVAASGLSEGALGPPPHDWQALWPVLQEMATWWQERRQQVQEPQVKLERATFHMHPRWVQAIRREADLTGESYADVVNRALRQYFQGREI